MKQKVLATLTIFLMIWTIKRTNQFKKNYKRLPENLQIKFKQHFFVFLENTHEPRLNTHKLK